MKYYLMSPAVTEQDVCESDIHTLGESGKTTFYIGQAYLQLEHIFATDYFDVGQPTNTEYINKLFVMREDGKRLTLPKFLTEISHLQKIR